MSNFNRILENIEMELAELKKINEELIKENQLLRKQLGKHEKVISDEISIVEAFNHFSITPPVANGLHKRALLFLKRSGYKTVNELEGKTIYDLLSIKNLGIETCAIIVIVLEHYGVQISVEPKNSMHTKLLKIKEAIVKYKAKIIFD